MEIFDIETMARLLHESNREPVMKQRTLVKHTELGFEFPTFVEWSDLPEHAKEGKRDSARFILKRCKVTQLTMADISGE